MVTPEDDDGVVCIGAFFEGVEDATEHGVGVVDGGEVALNAFFPLSFGGDVVEVAVVGVTFTAFGEVFEVVFFVAGGELDAVEGEGFEVFGGDEPWLMGPVDTAGEEEGLFVCFGELLTDVLGDEVVAAKVFVGGFDRAPVGVGILPRAAYGKAGGADGWVEGLGDGIFAFFGGVVFIP